MVAAVLLLLLLPAGISIAQVEVELRRGGTLKGEIVASDDSTITLRVFPDNGAPRDAVLRRSDITFLRNDTIDDSILVSEDDEYDDSFKHKIDANVLLSWQPGHYSDNRQGVAAFGYEYTSTPRLHDDEHRTAASKSVVPTSYYSVLLTSGPYGSNTVEKSTEHLFGGYLVNPGLAVGAGVLHTRESEKTLMLFNYLITSIEMFAFSGHLDLFTSDRVRLREVVTVGTVKKQYNWTSGVNVETSLLFHIAHQLDYAIDREQAYIQQVGIQYEKHIGSIVNMINGYEYAFSQYIAIAPELQMRFRFPTGGKMNTVIGIALGLVCQPSSNWIIVLRSGYMSEVGMNHVDAFNAGVLIGWRF